MELQKIKTAIKAHRKIYLPLKLFFNFAKKRVFIFKDMRAYINQQYHDSCPSLTPVYAKELCSDLQWYKKIKKTQLNEGRPLFLDRQFEIKEFFGKSTLDLFAYFFLKGFPHTRRFKENLMSFFSNNTADDSSLSSAYANSAFHYSLRLMLAYERYSSIIPYLDCILGNLHNSTERLSVLDYGCGVSDIGLLFATLGAKVTLADLDNEKFEFAVWRFHRRKLTPKIIKIVGCDIYPSLPESEYDLIIAEEIFEHVRNPLLLLQNLTSSLRGGGLLFDTSDGLTEKRRIEGDHLEEAFEIGLSKEYRRYFDNNYNRYLPKLFKKL